MRRFLPALRPTILCCATLAAGSWIATAASADQFRTYFGTYSTGGSISRGIYTAVFDSETGQLSEPKLAAASVNPAFLAIHPTRPLLLAVNEVSEGEGRGNGSVSAFKREKDGSLTEINQQPSHGGAPCHLSIDATGRFVLIANYVGGNLAVYPIDDDGSLGPATCIVQHEGSSIDPDRQRQSHAHSINLSSDNRFAYAADLGIDQVKIYQFNETDGTLSPADPESVAVTPGGGPRHFAIHPSGKFAYTNNELSAVVTAFRRDPATGGLTVIQSLPTLPADFDGRKSTAECLVHPSGKFVYVSNRGHDSIAGFSIDQSTGQMTPIGITHTGGEEPRNFYIDPTGKWLLAANQNSDSVIVFQLDPKTGTLTATDNRIVVGMPVCIRMLPLK